MYEDPVLKMYDVQAQLVETKEELEKIRKERDELKNEKVANDVIKRVEDFEKEYSNHFKAMEENLKTLTTTVSHNHETFVEIKKTLKKNMKDPENEAILLLGGWNGNKIVDSLLLLQNIGENDENWKELNIQLPYAVGCHGAQFLNDNLYIFGGIKEKEEVLNSTYKLIRGHKWLTNSLQWEKMADMNQKRYYISNSSVILNNRIWVIGGHNGNNQLKNVEMYDPQTNVWENMKEMNECRSLAAAAVVNGKIFCCGGYNGTTFLKSAESYDPSSDVWTLISDMPGPNGACGIVVMDGYLIIVGGKASKGNYLNSVWVLNTADKSAEWIEKEPSLSYSRCQFSIAKIDGKMFICGGRCIEEEESGSYVTNDVEIFDGQLWRNGPKMILSVESASAVAIPMNFARSLN